MDKKMFKIEITEILQRVIEIEAESIDIAIETIAQKYKSEEIVLDWSDYIDNEINAHTEKTDWMLEKLYKNNFYQIQNNSILFWGLNIKAFEVEISEELRYFILENNLSINEVCEFNQTEDFKLFELATKKQYLI